MKIWTAAAVTASLFFAGDKLTRPEAFLKPGNKIVYSFYDHRDRSPSTANHTLVIQKVETVNGKSEVSGILSYVEDGNPKYKWSQDFACDSINFYVRAANLCYPIVDDKTTAVSYSGDTLVYPFAMKVGDALPDGHALKIESEQYSKERRQLTVSSRKVVSVDSLDLSFGKITAYKITSDVKYVSASAGESADKFTEVHHMIEWFSPKYGVVKRRYEFGQGAYTVTTMERPGL